MTLETLNNSVDGIPSEVKDYQADDLSQRLNFLQSFGLFKDIKPSKVLLPVAINMSVIKFKYGEFLTRVGDRPAGMYLIKSGQCIVGLSRTAKRDKHWRDIPGHREPINDKLELFNKFDAENTLLNNVEIQDRVFQNGRIYVEDDKQIRDKILYHDFVQFSKLFPKRQFGGRCLLPFEMYMQLKRIYFGPESLKKPGNEPVTDMRSEEEYQMKSFLDIVADSAVVEVYMITKQGLQYLNDHYMKNIYESIVQEKEPDRPYHEEKINEKKAEMIHDQEEHLKTVKNIMKANKIAKYGVMAIKDQS